MGELRLVPAALTVWAAALLILLTGQGWPAGVLVAAVGIGVALLRQPGQAVLVVALGGAVALMTGLRAGRAEAVVFPEQLTGVLRTAAGDTSTGGGILRLTVPGHAAQLTVFTEEAPEALPAGTTVHLDVTYSESSTPGLTPVVGNAEILATAPPTGWAATAAHIKETFAAAVRAAVAGEHRGLIPGMVLGDTSLQDAVARDLYVDTGLSHLSAVSGSNVTIVTTAAIMLCRALGIGPRLQTGVAALALLGFVALVGTEPSVLRAAVTGLVGLAAVLGSAHMEPVHALCLAVIVLVAVDPDLAVSWGFALSVAATAGIVVLTPLLTRPLARTRLPLLVVRSLAVSLAADIVTAPLIALMAGEVSLVAVIANVLVSPVTAPVTVLGLIAAALALLPGPGAGLLLQVIAPLTWWIHASAETLTALPVVTVPADPLWVILGYGWVIAALLAGRTRVLLITAAVGLAGYIGITPASPPIPLEELVVHRVDDPAEIDTAPPGRVSHDDHLGAGRPAD
ncbi:MAG TPA: ComEC/Rec2 family competence protein, partial [Corynebacterium sp.]|nr:ComEC/Rec2 family competence protein [Corynebacterium sp.]